MASLTPEDVKMSKWIAVLIAACFGFAAAPAFTQDKKDTPREESREAKKAKKAADRAERKTERAEKRAERKAKRAAKKAERAAKGEEKK